MKLFGSNGHGIADLAAVAFGKMVSELLGLLATTQHHIIDLAEIHLLIALIELIGRCVHHALAVEYLRPIRILIRWLQMRISDVQLIIEPGGSAVLAFANLAGSQVLTLLIKAVASQLLTRCVRSSYMWIDWRVRRCQQVGIDRRQGLSGNQWLVNLQLVGSHRLKRRITLCCGRKSSHLVWILVQMNKILIVLQFFDALLKLYLVCVLGDFFIFGHQIMLQLALNKELQCLNEILI